MIIKDILQDIFQENVLSYHKKNEILKEITPLIIQDNRDIEDEIRSVEINSPDDFINFCENYSDIVSREVTDNLRQKFIQIFSDLIVQDPREADQKKLVELIHKIIRAEIAKNSDNESNDAAIFYCQSLIDHIDEAYITDKILLKCLLYLEDNKKIPDMTLEPLTDSLLPSQSSSPRRILPEQKTPSPRKNVSALGNFVNYLEKTSVIDCAERKLLNKILLGSFRSGSDYSTDVEDEDQPPKAPLKISAKITETEAIFYNKNKFRFSAKITFNDQSEVKSPTGEGRRKSGLFVRYYNDPNEQITKQGLAKICVNNITNILTDLLKDECYAKLRNDKSLSAILNLANYIGGFQSHSNDDLRKCFKMKKFGGIELSNSEIDNIRKFSMEFQRRAMNVKILSPENKQVGLRTKRIVDFIGRENIKRLCDDVLKCSCNLAEDDSFLNSITCELSQQQCDLSSDSSSSSPDALGGPDLDLLKRSHGNDHETVRRAAIRFDAKGVKRVLFQSPLGGPSSTVSKPRQRTEFSSRTEGAQVGS